MSYWLIGAAVLLVLYFFRGDSVTKVWETVKNLFTRTSSSSGTKNELAGKITELLEIRTDCCDTGDGESVKATDALINSLLQAQLPKVVQEGTNAGASR